MKNKVKKIISICMIALMLGGMLTGCGEKDNKLTFAYQYGIQYLPAKIVKEQNLIEKHYGKDVEIEWQTLNSGAAINEAFTGGSIDGGFIGTPVAITGVTKGVPYKVFTGISNVPNRLIVNDDSIKTLKDFGKNDQIALVSQGSLQHITLAMAAKKNLGDAHALDKNIVGMSHPEGMGALNSGSVKGQVTTVPYSNKALAESKNHEIKAVYKDANTGATNIVGVASTKLYEEDKELYDAIVKAFDEAIDYINDPANREEIINSTYEEEGVSKKEMKKYLESKDVVFDKDVTGLMKYSKFMTDEKFLDTAASEDSKTFVFDNVTVK